MGEDVQIVMRDLDYQSLIFWDVIFFPLACSVVSGVFAFAFLYEKSHSGSGLNLRGLHTLASLTWFATSILLILLLLTDLREVTSAMNDDLRETGVDTYVQSFNYALVLSLSSACIVSSLAIWSRARIKHSD